MKKLLALVSAALLFISAVLLNAAADPVVEEEGDPVWHFSDGVTKDETAGTFSMGAVDYAVHENAIDLAAADLDVSVAFKTGCANNAQTISLYFSKDMPTGKPEGNDGVFQVRFTRNQESGKFGPDYTWIGAEMTPAYGGGYIEYTEDTLLTVRFKRVDGTILMYLNDVQIYQSDVAQKVSDYITGLGEGYLTIGTFSANGNFTTQVLQVNGQPPLKLQGAGDEEEGDPVWHFSDGVTKDEAAGTFSMGAVDYAVRENAINLAAADLDVSVALKTGCANNAQTISLYFSKDMPTGKPEGNDGVFQVRFTRNQESGKFGPDYTWIGAEMTPAYGGGYIEYTEDTLLTVRFKRVDGMILMYLNDVQIYQSDVAQKVSDYITGLGKGYLTIGTFSANGGFTTQVLQVNGQPPLKLQGAGDEEEGDPVWHFSDGVTKDEAAGTFSMGAVDYAVRENAIHFAAADLDVSVALKTGWTNGNQMISLYFSKDMPEGKPAEGDGVFQVRFSLMDGKFGPNNTWTGTTSTMAYGGGYIAHTADTLYTIRFKRVDGTILMYINDTQIYYSDVAQNVSDFITGLGKGYLTIGTNSADGNFITQVLEVNGQPPLVPQGNGGEDDPGDEEEGDPVWHFSDGVIKDEVSGTFSMGAMDYAVRENAIHFAAADLDVSVALKTGWTNGNQMISLYFSKDMPEGKPAEGDGVFRVRFALDGGKFGLNHTWLSKEAVPQYAGGYIEHTADTLYTIRFKRVDGMILMYINDTQIYQSDVAQKVSDYITGLGKGYLTIGTESYENSFTTQVLKVNEKPPLVPQGSADEDAPYQGEARYPTVPLTGGQLKWLGRITEANGAMSLDWSASGVEFNFKGTAAQMQISATDSSDIYCTYVAVYVNGVRTQKIRLKSGNYWYTLASGLDAAETTTIRVVKLNEVGFSSADITALAMDGELAAAPASKDMIFEVIGDSISAGYGVLSGPDDGFTGETEDAAYTYGTLLAEKLNADLFLSAASGYGVYMNVSGSTEEVMPDMYELARPLVSKTLKWEHQVHPDLILVNLGTNDNAANAPKDKVQEAAKAFLARLIELHPQAKIVWAYGLMNQDYMETLREAVEEVAAENEQVYFIALPGQSNFSSSTGASGHPNAETHEKVADYLYPVLTRILDGTYDDEKPETPEDPDDPEEPIKKADWVTNAAQDSNEGKVLTSVTYNEDGTVTVSGDTGSTGLYIGLDKKIDLTAEDLDVSWVIRLDQFPITDLADEANIQFILSDSLDGMNPMFSETAVAFRARVYRSYGDEFTFPESLFHNEKLADTPSGALMAYAGRSIYLNDPDVPTFTFQIKRVEGKIRFLIDGETLYTADGYDQDRLPAQLSQALEKEFANGAYLSIACATVNQDPMALTILSVNGQKAWEKSAEDPDDGDDKDDDNKGDNDKDDDNKGDADNDKDDDNKGDADNDKDDDNKGGADNDKDDDNKGGADNDNDDDDKGGADTGVTSSAALAAGLAIGASGTLVVSRRRRKDAKNRA